MRVRVGVLVVLLGAFCAEGWAAPGEPSGLRFTGAQSFTWNGVAGATGYDVYKGLVSALRGGQYGTCMDGSVVGTSSGDQEAPPAGQAFFYLVSSFDETGESRVTTSSDGVSHAPAVACIPARRLFAMSTNGIASDGVEDGVEPPRNPSLFAWDVARDVGAVNLATGEVSVAAEDLHLGGRGFDWSFARTYRSQVSYDGPLGFGWDFADNAHLQPLGGDFVFHDGAGDRLLFHSAPGTISWTSPPGVYGRIVRNGDASLTLRITKPGIDKTYRRIKWSRTNAVDLFRLKKQDGEETDTDCPGPGCGSARITAPLALKAKEKSNRLFHVAAGIGHLKSDGIVHRDLAARNVLLDDRRAGGGGSPGLLDFDATLSFAAPNGPVLAPVGEASSNPIPGVGIVVKRPCPKCKQQARTAGNPIPGVGIVVKKTTADALSLGRSVGGLHKTKEALEWGLGLTPLNDDPGSRRSEAQFQVGDLDGDGVPELAVSEMDFAADGRLLAVRDQFGNARTYLYDNQKLLRQVVDTLGHAVTYEYTADGHVSSVGLPDGRNVVYLFGGAEHDARRRLASASTGGSATSYTYASDTDPHLDGNLLGVTTGAQQASGPPTLQVVYGAPGTFVADRAVQVTVGGTNGSGVPAGGTYAIDYAALNAGADPGLLGLPRRRATVTDRNGDVTIHDHNAFGHELSHVVQFARARPGRPAVNTLMNYNADGELVEIDYPTGRRAYFTYDSPGADRYREGNLLQLRLVADAAATGGRGDGHGGESPDRMWTFTYEPVFNQLASITAPRGNDPAYVPDNGGTWSPERYTEHFTYDYEEGDPATNGIAALAARFGIALGAPSPPLGDIDGDGRTDQAHGAPIRWTPPEVLLDPSSRQAAIEGGTTQHASALFSHNDFGQLVRVVDPESNVHLFAYHPEAAPGGDGVSTPPPPDGRNLDGTTGGLLAAVTEDAASDANRDNKTNPAPSGITHRFVWDSARDLPTRMMDGRGVLTRASYDELDRLIELRRAAATADASGPAGDPPTGYGEAGLAPVDSSLRFGYDGDGNVVSVTVSNTDGTRGLGPAITHTYGYDLLGHVVSETHPTSPGAALTWQRRYDGEGHLASTTDPGGASDTWVTDEAGLLYAATRGASGPGGGEPEHDYLDYDDDGDLLRATDALGNVIDLHYDGHDRLVKLVDKLGGTIEVWVDDDGDEIPTEVLVRGTAGGASPSDRSGSANVDLAKAYFRKDERGRVFRRDDVLFTPNGASPMRPPSIAEGPLLPGDAAVNTIYEFDKLSRPTFVHRDSGVLETAEWDGASRVRRTAVGGVADVPAQETITSWDANGNLGETLTIQRSSTAGPPDETFFTTYFYDALDRRVQVTDNLGGTRRFAYDTLDGLVAESDALGPAGAGTIHRKTPSYTGVTVPVNGHGNVTRYAYDGLDRITRRDTVLTASGQGDGTLNPAPDTSNAYNPDGLITAQFTYTNRNLRAGVTDDRGNVTSFEHDNAGRLSRTTFADGTQQTSTYDGNGNVVTATDRNGTVSKRTFDHAGRLAQVSITRAAGVEGTTLQDFQYDGLDRVTRARDNNDPAQTDDDSIVRLVYDSLGRVIEESHQVGQGTPARPIDNAWLAESQLVSVTYPAGGVTSYSYDSAGRNILVSRDLNVKISDFGMSRTHTRTFSDGVTSTTLDDSGSSDVGYDGLGRITPLRHLSGGALLAGFAYRYDAENDTLAVRRLHQPAPAGVMGERYAYDSAHRLTASEVVPLDPSFSPVGANADATACTLDGEGNWPLMVHNGVAFGATPNNVNLYDEDQFGGLHVDDGIRDDFHDRLGTPPDGFNLVHDRNGNQTDTGIVQLAYDSLDRPVRSITGGATLGRYAHDAFGRVVRRQVFGGTPVDLRYTPSFALHGVAEERDSSGSVALERVFAGASPLWITTGATGPMRLLPDAQGSIVALAVAGGGVAERVVYDAFGKPTFETSDNVPKVDSTGRPAAQSDFGNASLFHALRYDPESGSRSTDPLNDFAGFIDDRGTYFNPVQDRSTSRRVKAEHVGRSATPSLGGLPPLKHGDGANSTERQVACGCCLTCRAEVFLCGCKDANGCEECCQLWQNKMCGGGGTSEFQSFSPL